MKTAIVNENQRGLLFKNGRYAGLLDPGKYTLWGNQEVELLSLDAPISSEKCLLETLLKDPKIANYSATVQVADQELALHFADEKFSELLTPGKHAFWTIGHTHRFQLTSIAAPDPADNIPGYIFRQIPDKFYWRASVAPYQKGLLYFDRQLIRILEPGIYYFWKNNVEISVQLVDTRLCQLKVTGQEIMTQDKVSLRINFVCTYRVADYIRVYNEIDDYQEQLHVAVQLALRDFVGEYRLDDLLQNKDQLSGKVLAALKTKEDALYLEIVDAAVKDIILPGEIRDIMNTVLVAEKKAQANVITRREEVASTRSLLNTAKLMEENQTLYKLKELEYLERICEGVGNITLNGSGDVLAQLTALLGGKGAPSSEN